jgi:hypothetical protein
MKWEEILQVASKYINNPKTSLSNKVNTQIYTGFGTVVQKTGLNTKNGVDIVQSLTLIYIIYMIKDCTISKDFMIKTGNQ